MIFGFRAQMAELGITGYDNKVLDLCEEVYKILDENLSLVNNQDFFFLIELYHNLSTSQIEEKGRLPDFLSRFDDIMDKCDHQEILLLPILVMIRSKSVKEIRNMKQRLTMITLDSGDDTLVDSRSFD